MDKFAKEINLVWLKRDLRSFDHAPFEKACEEKLPFKIIYIFEPLIENYYDFDIRHWRFIYQSLKELSQKIPIQIYYAEAETVFQSLLEEFNIKHVYSHNETGLSHTFARDLHIKKLITEKGYYWKEFQSNGVVRGLRERVGWDAQWIKFMKGSQNDPSWDKAIFLDEKANEFLPDELERQLNKVDSLKQVGGESKAKSLLHQFLQEKVEQYFSQISYPDKASYHCSRLSPYIAWGNISIRHIYQACDEAQRIVTNKESLKQFMARLKWQAHFIQKLETDVSIEKKNINSAFDGIRTKKNKKYLKAWKEGLTGFPLVDASMRCVKETGYLNFRMRAMVTSFLTHHLWQPWREGARYLSRQFLDYEPGIHYAQFQMQAGTTGVNTLRIYNPVKQSQQKDRDGEFIKKWVPELRNLPRELIHNPWEITAFEEQMYDIRIGTDYPLPIVNLEKSAAMAREKLWQLKNSEHSKKNAPQILRKYSKARNSKRTQR